MKHSLTKSSSFRRCVAYMDVGALGATFWLVLIFFLVGCATQPYEGPAFKQLKTWDVYGPPMVGADTYIRIENCGVDMCIKNYKWE